MILDLFTITNVEKFLKFLQELTELIRNENLNLKTVTVLAAEIGTCTLS